MDLTLEETKYYIVGVYNLYSVIEDIDENLVRCFEYDWLDGQLLMRNVIEYSNIIYKSPSLVINTLDELEEKVKDLNARAIRRFR